MNWLQGKWTGAAASVLSLAVVTGAIYLFREAVPVLSLGVLYLFAVLPVAVVWGRAYAILVSVASMLAFNFFFLPPRHTFRLEDRENWFALAVYLVTGIVVSEIKPPRKMMKERTPAKIGRSIKKFEIMADGFRRGARSRRVIRSRRRRAFASTGSR